MRLELKNIFRDFGVETKLIEIENILSEHEKRFIAELRQTKKHPKRLIGQNALNYIQMALIRSIHLSE